MNTSERVNGPRAELPRHEKLPHSDSSVVPWGVLFGYYRARSLASPSVSPRATSAKGKQSFRYSPRYSHREREREGGTITRVGSEAKRHCTKSGGRTGIATTTALQPEPPLFFSDTLHRTAGSIV